MKQDTYYLTENGKAVKRSACIEKLINHAARYTSNAEIYYNNNLVWVQRPENYYK